MKTWFVKDDLDVMLFAMLLPFFAWLRDDTIATWEWVTAGIGWSALNILKRYLKAWRMHTLHVTFQYNPADNTWVRIK